MKKIIDLLKKNIKKFLSEMTYFDGILLSIIVMLLAWIFSLYFALFDVVKAIENIINIMPYL